MAPHKSHSTYKKIKLNHEPNQVHHESTYMTFLIDMNVQTISEPQLNFSQNSFIQNNLQHELTKRMHIWIDRTMHTPLEEGEDSSHSVSGAFFLFTLPYVPHLLCFVSVVSAFLWGQHSSFLTTEHRLPRGDNMCPRWICNGSFHHFEGKWVWRIPSCGQNLNR